MNYSPLNIALHEFCHLHSTTRQVKSPHKLEKGLCSYKGFEYKSQHYGLRGCVGVGVRVESQDYGLRGCVGVGVRVESQHYGLYGFVLVLG